MSEPTQSNTKAGCPPVPESLIKAKRDELTDIKLNITKMGEKDLPDDLWLHYLHCLVEQYLRDLDFRGLGSQPGAAVETERFLSQFWVNFAHDVVAKYWTPPS